MTTVTDDFTRIGGYSWDGTTPRPDNWGIITDESPWPDVSCALPDMRYAVYAIIGAVVVAAALTVAGIKYVLAKRHG